MANRLWFPGWLVVGSAVVGVVVLLHDQCAATPPPPPPPHQHHQHHQDDHPCQRDCSTGTQPMTCRYDWLIENYLVLSRACFECPNNVTDCWREQCVAADGVRRSVRTINRQLPGPALQVCEGDTVEVAIQNQMMMSAGVTIHWHGIRQRGSQHMDGVSMLTQCPVPTFTSFTYRFKAENPGTHFYHSHSGMFRGEGPFGPLVIRQSSSRDPQRALYDLDLPQHVMVLNDWSHRATEDLYTHFFHSSDGSQAPANILINGRGMYPVPDEKSRSDLHSASSTTPLSRFDVTSDVRYRFRVINAGALRCPLQLSVDNHSLLLIASDGSPLEPVPMSSILIFSGERYDFVLQTKKEQAGVHWIRVQGLDLCEIHKIQQLAILNYVDRDQVSGNVSEYPAESMSYDHVVPTTDGVHFNRWFLNRTATDPDEHAQIASMTSLLPDDESLREKADRQIFLDFAYRRRNNVHFHDAKLYPAGGKGYKTVSSPMINNISNLLPPAPLLTQAQDVSPDVVCDADSLKRAGRDCAHEFCECTHVVSCHEGEVVELVIFNSNDQYGFTHPLHLHGYSYRVVAVHRPKQPIKEKHFKELDRKGRIHRRLSGAPLKDTIPIPNGGYLILRIFADNPGAWFMHCHISMHAEVGMAVTLQVKSAEGHALPSPAPRDFPRCGSWAPGPPRHASDDVSEPHDARGDGHDVGAGVTSGGGGAWAVPALISLVCVNVVVVVLGLLYWVSIRRRSTRQRQQASVLYPAVGRMRDARIDSSEDESSNLLRG